MNQLSPLLSMRRVLFEYSFDPKRNSLALAPAGSVMTIGLSKKGSSHSENQFDGREQD